MAPASSRPTVETRQLPAGKTVTNILGTCCAGRPVAGSFIKHWERHSGCLRGDCVAEGCNNAAKEGGHVKIAGGPMASLVNADWWIIPVCKDHNKGLSCKTFKVKQVVAVEAPPKFKERAKSWEYDFKKLLETMKKLVVK